MSNVSQSKLMSQLKAKAKGAWGRARNVDPKARGAGGFPPNLKNLVSVCQSHALKATQKGDPMFQLTTIVKDPEEFVGRKATFMWFINDTEWATVEDNLNQMSNDLQLLGVEMPEDLADVPKVLKELCERGVHLLFNTGGPRKNGGSPNLFIQGLAEEWEDAPEESEKAESSEEETEEETEEAETEEETEAEEAESEEEATEEPWIPAKGEQYNYKPPKEKKKLLVEVVAVNKKTESFDLKTTKLKPPKIFKGIKWFDKEGNPTVESI